MNSNRSFIVHAHFYQPPRENPLTNDIPNEISAHPYHDWNERVFQTCYLPNIQIGNFSRISFNIGPTLSRWLRAKHPDAMKLIVEADQKAIKETGHGNALAQAYHHTILPLATREEKETEIYWGIRDFEHTFGRSPQGMWLPETAVDLETLEILANQGIKFTILAPWQVKLPADGGQSPYVIHLPGDKKITIFTYAGELSARASFDNNATKNADDFVKNHLETQFLDNKLNQYVMMATDGELYGHHQTFREMFLSQMVNGSLKSASVNLEAPAVFLEKSSALPVASIREYTSWSCHHGVKRWSEECECTPGAKWKLPLREILKQIAREIDFECQKYLNSFGMDLFQTRKSYISVIVGKINFDSWLSLQTTLPLDDETRKVLAELFRAQEFRLKMFASCGWFFNDFDRIEPRNNIAFAAYAIYLIDKTFKTNLGSKYENLLANVQSEQTGLAGAVVFKQAYESYVNTRSVD